MREIQKGEGKAKRCGGERQRVDYHRLEMSERNRNYTVKSVLIQNNDFGN